MNQLEITLNGDVPSKKNSRRIIQVRGRPMSIPSKNYVEWHKEKVKELKIENYPLIENISHIEITFYPSTKRRADLTNKAESVMDLLVDMDIIPDDNWFIVGDVRLLFGGIDKENPRAETTIYSFSEPKEQGALL